MAPRVVHAKVSGKPAGSDSTRVYGTDWDADHTITGLTIGTDVQGHDATLDALAAFNSNGMLAQTATDTFAARTITGVSNRTTITNGDGVAGNPTIDIHASYVGQATITTLGTIATGVWHGTKIALAYGGTNADLSATGGAHQVLMQTSSGGNVTVAQLTLADLASQAAYTINGNATGSSAAPAAFTIAGLTHKASPTGADKIMISDTAASDAFKYASITEIVGAATVSVSGTPTSGQVAVWTNATTIQGVAIGSTVTNTLSGDVTLTTAGTYYTGPTCAQGTTGTWLAVGVVTFFGTNGDKFVAKLWDGTTVISTAQVQVQSGQFWTLTLNGIIASPAGNIRIDLTNLTTSTTPKMTFNSSGFSKDCTLTAVRVA